jgi:hypothetical protein
MAIRALYGDDTSDISSSPEDNDAVSNSFDIPKQTNLFESDNAIIPFGTNKYLESRSEASTYQRWIKGDDDRTAHDVQNLYKSFDLTLNKGEDLNDVLNKIHKTIGLYDGGAQNTFKKYTKEYNRFKLPTLNDAFQKGFAHVFFIRPDLNTEAMKKDADFCYAFKNSPSMTNELCQANGSDHDFMLSLSNKAASFSLTDEYIDTDTYGKTFAGWKIAYGKNNVESKTAGDFSITYHDDRTLHIYHLHKLWVDYIAKCYHGSISPKSEYIKNHVLDYASACYYIVTAEDAETIIFWSKYYGVFPSTVPSTQYSWAYGNVIQDPTIEIKYQYSFKEDFNPAALTELNVNANIDVSGEKYVPTYDPKLGHAGDTWVGVPYIEVIDDKGVTDGDIILESPYTFKLRFKKAP